MKYIKQFENLINVPEVGDYVLIHDELWFKYPNSGMKRYSDFVNNTIGQISEVSKSFVGIKYRNIPDDIDDFFNSVGGRSFKKEDIVAFAKTKKELEMKLTEIKYNL